MSSEQTVIELSKRKIGLVVLGSCIFVAIGIWMLALDDRSIRSMAPIHDPSFAHALGIASIAFFGLCAIVAVIKFFDKKPGLIFDATGIMDNASGVSAGLIPWNEIMGAKTHEVFRQKTLIIEIKDAEKYLDRGNWLKQFVNRANYKLCGSPIAIAATTLKSNFSELLAVFNQYHQKYGTSRPRA